MKNLNDFTTEFRLTMRLVDPTHRFSFEQALQKLSIGDLEESSEGNPKAPDGVTFYLVYADCWYIEKRSNGRYVLTLCSEEIWSDLSPYFLETILASFVYEQKLIDSAEMRMEKVSEFIIRGYND